MGSSEPFANIGWLNKTFLFLNQITTKSLHNEIWMWNLNLMQILYWDDLGDKRPVMCLVLTRWSRITSACRSAHSHTESWLWASRLVLYWVIFMVFKFSLINSGANQTNTKLLHVLIRSWVFISSSESRVEDTETPAQYKPAAASALSSWDQRNSVFHCSSTKSLSGCFTWTSSDLTACVALSKWVWGGRRAVWVQGAGHSAHAFNV